VFIYQSMKELRGECLAACLTSHNLTALKRDKGWCGYDTTFFGEVHPLVTAFRIRDGDEAFPDLKFRGLMFDVLARPTSFLDEEVNLWFGHLDQ